MGYRSSGYPEEVWRHSAECEESGVVDASRLKLGPTSKRGGGFRPVVAELGRFVEGVKRGGGVVAGCDGHGGNGAKGTDWFRGVGLRASGVQGRRRCELNLLQMEAEGTARSGLRKGSEGAAFRRVDWLRGHWCRGYAVLAWRRIEASGPTGCRSGCGALG